RCSISATFDFSGLACEGFPVDHRRFGNAMDDTYGPRTAAWRGLMSHAEVLRRATIRELFDAEPNRFNHFSLQREGLLLDYSRQLLDRHALGLLLELAEQTEVRRWIELMFAGHPINNT